MKTNKQPERSIDEIVEEFKKRFVSFNLYSDSVADESGTAGDYIEEFLTQTLTAERQKREDVVRDERKRIAELVQDSIWPGELNEHTNSVLKSIKLELTQPPTPLTNDKE